MTTIYVWSGYRTAHKEEFVWVEFDGERICTLTYDAGGRTVELTFYRRAHDGQIVVHEVRRGGEYTNGAMLVFDDIDDAVRSVAEEFADEVWNATPVRANANRDLRSAHHAGRVRPDHHR